MDLLAALEAQAGVDTLITLDIETFYAKDYSLSKKGVTTESYVRDPRFEFIGIGVKVGSSPAVWMELHEFENWSAQVPWERCAVLCHNTAFDGFALHHHLGILAGLYVDTLSIGRALLGLDVGKSLASMVKHYDAGVKGREVENAFGKRRSDFTPEEFARYGAYCTNDVDITYNLLWKVVEQIPELEVWLIDLVLRCFIDPTIELDHDLTRAALFEELQKKADLLARVATDRSVLMSNEKFSALLLDMGVDPPMKVSAKKTATARAKDPEADEVMVPALAKSDDGFKALLEHEREEIRWLAEARAGVKSTILSTRAQRFLDIASRGPMPVFLRYNGAHTGRLSAGDSSNFQNLHRGGALRKALLAPEGHDFIVSDSSQVEARKNAWIAGHSELMDTFRRNDAKNATHAREFSVYVRQLGRKPDKEEKKQINRVLAERGIEKGDFYSDAGSTYFGKPLSAEETPNERQTAKSMLLGLGFQMGAQRFSSELLKGMLGAPPVQFTRADAATYRVDVAEFASDPYNMKWVKKIISRLPLVELVVHCAVAKYFVDLYREMNPAIVGLWEACSQAIEAMATNEDFAFGPGKQFRTVHEGLVLPSGRVLHYPGLRRSGKAGWSYRGGRGKGEKAYTKIYGGLLTENCVQASARDVIMEQALVAKAEGIRVVTLTHDEIVAIAPTPEAEKSLEKLLKIMSTPPTWCADMPLAAEGGFSRSYGHAK